jgi:hypothetical protein
MREFLSLSFFSCPSSKTHWVAEDGRGGDRRALEGNPIIPIFFSLLIWMFFQDMFWFLLQSNRSVLSRFCFEEERRWYDGHVQVHGCILSTQLWPPRALPPRVVLRYCYWAMLSCLDRTRNSTIYLNIFAGAQAPYPRTKLNLRKLPRWTNSCSLSKYKDYILLKKGERGSS